MWICDQCETQNEDAVTICYICGAEHLSTGVLRENSKQDNRNSNLVFSNSSSSEKTSSIEFAWDTPIAETSQEVNVNPVRRDWVEDSPTVIRDPHGKARPKSKESIKPSELAEIKRKKRILRIALVAANLGLLVLNAVNIFGVL